MNELNDLWRELAEKSESNAMTIKVADTVSDIVVKLIETRVEKGLTQVQVAKMAGISPRTMANLENPKNSPRIDTIVRVATVLGLKLEVK